MRSCIFHPQWSNLYCSNVGAKLVKITVARRDWLDPSTFCIMSGLVNTDNNVGHKFRLIGGPWPFFSRMRLLGGCQILGDIDMYNRVHEMFNIFTAEGNRDNAYAKGIL